MISLYVSTADGLIFPNYQLSLISKMNVPKQKGKDSKEAQGSGNSTIICSCGKCFTAKSSLEQHWRDSPKHKDEVQPNDFPRVVDQSKASAQYSITVTSC